MKCAFVCSGGGLKAYAFHLGALRALEEAGFRRTSAADPREPAVADDLDLKIQSYIGSSAGACVAAACIYFQTIEEAEGVIGLKKSTHPRFRPRTLFRPNLSFLSNRTGIFDASAVERYFRERATDNDFRTIGPEVYICATQLNGSQKVVFGPREFQQRGTDEQFIAYVDDVPISQAIAASISVPGIFRPYPIVHQPGGEPTEYIDGEVRETLSIHIARDTGVDLVIVSNTWMPYHYDAETGSISRRGLRSVLNQALTQIIEQKVDRVRNEFDRYLVAMETMRGFGREQGWPEPTIDELIRRVSSILRYRRMEEIYICPDRHDTDFNLAPAWSFKKAQLERARDLGYERAKAAIWKWKEERRARPRCRQPSQAVAR